LFHTLLIAEPKVGNLPRPLRCLQAAAVSDYLAHTEHCRLARNVGTACLVGAMVCPFAESLPSMGKQRL